MTVDLIFYYFFDNPLKMFVDEASILLTAGKGGDGCVHFHREKYVPKGGPDGGNGGRGGNIIFRAINNLHTLSDFRNKKSFKADNGKPGYKKNMTGKNGADLVIDVPVGTQIRLQKSEKVLVDLVSEKQQFLIARGGIGGKGNAGFVNSIRQAPQFAEKGDVGDALEIDLELKLIADVALVGLPSVGKSTFISVISNARPKIAEYHFTTLIPNLGVAKIDDRELVFVDVPGLIEGASEGKGLGIQFLKHIERAKYVLHLIDVNSDTPLKDFEVIQAELKNFSPALAQKPFLPVFTKIDSTDDELEDFLIQEFEQKFGIKPFKVSAVIHEGIDGILRYLASKIPEEFTEIEIKSLQEKEEVVEYRPGEMSDGRKVSIEKTDNWWTLKNPRLEQMVRQTDIDNVEAKERIYDVLKKWGVSKNLEKMGVVPGEELRIGEHFWEYRG